MTNIRSVYWILNPGKGINNVRFNLILNFYSIDHKLKSHKAIKKGSQIQRHNGKVQSDK